jgi:NADH-quinone oxidoreductase subunit G
MAEDTVTFTLNGQELTTKKGNTILQAATEAGIHIPHFCYHPDLSIAGNCRMCLVEVEGWPKLVISCSQVIQDGMVVHSNNENVRKAVRSVLEFILLNHPIDCPICDQSGECGLQDYYMEYGLHDSRMPLEDKVRKRKVVDLGPKIVLDTERCILCSRCIRFCDEVSKTNELVFNNRGVRSEITTFVNRPLDNPYSLNTVDICPVGALTSRDFRFKCRVWYLKTVDSVCDHCSTGCNMYSEQHKNRVYRFRPRKNERVNQSWMCDEGRLSYKKLYARERLETPMLRKNGDLQPVNWEEALNHVNRTIDQVLSENGPEAIGVIASPKLSTEELFLIKEYFSGMINTPNIDFRIDDGYETYNKMEDDILRRVDKNPNTMGALLLKLLPGDKGADVQGMLDKIDGNELKMLFLFNDDILQMADDDKIRHTLSRVEHLVLITPFTSELSGSCDVMLPLAYYLEKDGTFINGMGRLQKFQRSVNPPDHAGSVVQILNELMQLKGNTEDLSTPEKVFAKLGSANSVFEGISIAEIPETGIQLNIGEE